jgi:hypothetical protein
MKFFCSTQHPVFATHKRRSSRGAVLVLFAVGIVGIMGMAALAIDIGMVMQVEARLQAIADASALAAAQELPSDANAKTVAAAYATQNDSLNGVIVSTGEVVTGNWDGLGNFTPGGAPVNAVSVIARRTSARNNPVLLIFTKVFNQDAWNLAARAIATNGGGGPPSITRFLADEELFKDPAKQVLEDLAASMGKDFDWIIRDNDGDWFIDIPHMIPGCTVGDCRTKLKVPTGQTGDEGLFDISNPAFPFTDGTNGHPSYQDFLNYNEDTNSWRYGLIDTNDLDPLLGVSTVSHNHRYPEFVNPGQCQVSPVFKSDVSNLNPVGGVPAVNALGWRNGVIAFSLDSLAEDPDGDADQGGGSILPYVWITICDPAPFIGGGGLVTLPHSADRTIRLVR